MSPSASEQMNQDAQRREMQGEHGEAPQRENTGGAPLFTHSADMKGVLHPRFAQAPDEYDTAYPKSSTQAPNDQGRSSRVPG
jgi:hypothetical protein